MASSPPPNASPFLQNFYNAQQLALELKRETTSLEKSGTTYLNQLRASDFNSPSTNHSKRDHVLDNDDLESGGQNNPIMKKITQVSNIIQRTRASAYHCEQYASSPIERTKLSQIERQCADSEQLLHRFRQRLNEKRKQLETDSYLFGPKRGVGMVNPGYNESDQNHGDGDDMDSLMGGSGKKGDGAVSFFGQEQATLNNAMKTMQGALANAYSSIDSLDRQREMFYNIQRKTADIAAQLGFSNQVIGWISRQENTNTIITFVGMFITLFIIIVFYYWWNSGK